MKIKSPSPQLLVLKVSCHKAFESNVKSSFVLVQAADHLDDEEDVEDEETALENFTTSIDNEETDEYITFRNSMQGNNEFFTPPYQALNLRVPRVSKGQGKMKFLKLG